MRSLRTGAREHRYRDVWLLAVTVFVGFAIAGVQSTQDQQARGRRFAIGVTCATLSAISEAGEQVIAGPRGPDTSFDRALERLGYPPPTVRREQAERAAALYVQQISLRVQRQVGGKAAHHLVRKNGTIDCRELQRLSNTVVGQ